MASLSRFSDVSEEELNALIQKAILEKTEIARKCCLKNFKDKEKVNLKLSIFFFNKCLSKKYLLFLLQRFLLKSMSFYQATEIASW